MTNYINEKGVVSISDNVISKIAGLSAIECFGIVGLTNGGIRQEIVQLLRKEYLTKGIKVNHINDGEVVIDFHIIVAYGVNIATVAQNLVSAVGYNIREQLGINVNKINVYIDGVRVID